MKPICYAYPMLDFTDDSGMGEMMAAMLAWMAEQERKMIVLHGRRKACVWAVFHCR